MLKGLMLLVLFLWSVLPATGDIVFVSDWGDKERICVMNDHGGNVRSLTDAQSSDATIFHLPVYASDGSQIAFMMSQGEVNQQGLREWDIILMNADGSVQRNLTGNIPDAMDPSFSPDGESIVFATSLLGKPDEVGNLFIMGIKTRQLRLLTFGIAPDFSPDGKQIVYVGEGGIRVIDVAGRDSRLLVEVEEKGELENSRINLYYPSFSPDAEDILYFQKERHQGIARDTVKIFNTQTQNIEVLDIPKNCGINKVCWADDGAAVLFSGSCPGDIFTRIYKYRRSDGYISNLTPHPGNQWSMDSTPHENLEVSAKKKLTTCWGEIKR